ncbi:MAG: type V CRISPR-associated protein Cas4, partial [bacterium]
ERKNKVVKIYDGYKYQLYAQSFCLQEMGYEVERMFIYSMSDNKKYEVELPSAAEIKKFKKVINEMKNFSPENYKLKKNPEKCSRCIYCHLCCA